MLIKIDTAIATQITQEMFNDDSIALPRCCRRFKGSLHGYGFNEVAIWFNPLEIQNGRKLCVGDWVVDSIFATRMLTDEEFKSYAFDMNLRW